MRLGSFGGTGLIFTDENTRNGHIPFPAQYTWDLRQCSLVELIVGTD